jgi:hypothetical protein
MQIFLRPLVSLHLSLLALILLPPLCSSQQIVEVIDKLRFYNNETQALVKEYDVVNCRFVQAVSALPDVPQYNQNLTINSTFCFAASLSDYHQKCKDPLVNVSSSWIVTNQFQQKYTNEIINASEHDYANTLIDVMVIISDQEITAQKKYEHPTLISTIDEVNGISMLEYSYDVANVTYIASMQHTFIERCYILTPLIPYYYLTSFFMVLTIAIWVPTVFLVRKNQSFPIQQIMTFIPLLKAIDSYL